MCPRTKFEGTYEVVNIKFPRATIIDSAWDRRVLLSLLSNTKFWARKYRHSHASSINDKLHCDTENFKNERHTSCQLDKIFNIYCCSTHEDWIIRIKTAVTVVLKLKMFQKWNTHTLSWMKTSQTRYLMSWMKSTRIYTFLSTILVMSSVSPRYIASCIWFPF